MSHEKLCPTCGTEYPANERFCPRDGTALRSQDEGTDLVGTIIGERYHVLRKLGEGGMGQVYLAEHVKMRRKSAVKVLNPGMVHNADAISRFNREAANASRISHPNVAGIYDFGETADGLIYLAMEFVDGESLTSLMEKSSALPPIRAADITRQVADGLSVAHDMGIVHRDLKPDNIMIAKNRDGSDCVKVVDFGIAKAVGAENQKVTKSGLVIGTPEYMSPEQLAGDRLDAASDIYSLALVAFNMLTGKLPFPSETAQESLIMRLTDEPKSLTDMKPDTVWPPEVLAVMQKALKRNKNERYASAAEFGRELFMAAERMPAGAQPERGTIVRGAATAVVLPPTRVDGRVSVPGPTPGRSKRSIIAGGAAAVAAAIAAFVVVTRDGTTAVAKQDTIAPRSAVGAPATQPTDQATNVPTPIDNPPRRTGTASPPTTPPPSYEHDLDALYDAIRDGVSARKALSELSDWTARVKTPSDQATLAMIKAKAYLVTSGANRACPIFKSIKKTDLPAKFRTELDDGLQSCTAS